jgi:hypothetical protein
LQSLLGSLPIEVSSIVLASEHLPYYAAGTKTKAAEDLLKLQTDALSHFEVK